MSIHTIFHLAMMLMQGLIPCAMGLFALAWLGVRKAAAEKKAAKEYIELRCTKRASVNGPNLSYFKLVWDGHDLTRHGRPLHNFKTDIHALFKVDNHHPIEHNQPGPYHDNSVDFRVMIIPDIKGYVLYQHRGDETYVWNMTFDVWNEISASQDNVRFKYDEIWTQEEFSQKLKDAVSLDKKKAAAEAEAAAA